MLNLNLPVFYEKIRPILGGSMKQSTVDAVNDILAAYAEYGRFDPRDLANIFGQMKREVGVAMLPVREGFALSDKAARAYVLRQHYGYAKPTKYAGQWAYGRGQIQLTWDYNYEALDEALGMNGALLKNFDLVLDPAVSSKIAVVGMIKGIFTKKKLSDYFTDKITDWYHARQIVNGLDHAAEVAQNSKDFYEAILASH